jgi:hypothetical protein
LRRTYAAHRGSSGAEVVTRAGCVRVVNAPVDAAEESALGTVPLRAGAVTAGAEAAARDLRTRRVVRRRAEVSVAHADSKARTTPPKAANAREREFMDLVVVPFTHRTQGESRAVLVTRPPGAQRP